MLRCAGIQGRCTICCDRRGKAPADKIAIRVQARWDGLCPCGRACRAGPAGGALEELRRIRPGVPRRRQRDRPEPVLCKAHTSGPWPAGLGRLLKGFTLRLKPATAAPAASAPLLESSDASLPEAALAAWLGSWSAWPWRRALARPPLHDWTCRRFVAVLVFEVREDTGALSSFRRTTT